MISKRWFGISASLVSSILLSVNPVFHYHQHSMTVLIVSFMSFLFFLERLQTLDYRYTSNLSWFGLSLSLVVVFIHYGPGRIYAVILLSLWLIRFIYFNKNFPRSKYIIKNIFFKLGITFLISFFLLTLLDWKNLLSIISFYNVIYPMGAETIFFFLNETKALNNFLDTLFLNGKVLIESLTGLGNEYHSTVIADQGTGLRYQLLNPILFSFLIAGLVVCFSKLNKKDFFFSKPYFTCIVLFLIFFFSLFFSTIVFNTEITIITLSTNRIIYLLIPSYLLISAFLNFAFKKLKNKKIYFVFFLTSLFFFYVASINNLNKNYKNFNSKLNNINYEINGLESYIQWSDGTFYTKNKINQFGHNQLHSQYYNAAKKVKEKLDIANNNYYILNVDIKHFSENPTPYLNGFNYHSIFFSIYLNSFGANSAWVQMIDLNEPERDLFMYTPGKFSAPFVFKNNSSPMSPLISSSFKRPLLFFFKKLCQLISLSSIWAGAFSTSLIIFVDDIRFRHKS